MTQMCSRSKMKALVGLGRLGCSSVCICCKFGVKPVWSCMTALFWWYYCVWLLHSCRLMNGISQIDFLSRQAGYSISLFCSEPLSKLNRACQRKKMAANTLGIFCLANGSRRTCDVLKLQCKSVNAVSCHTFAFADLTPLVLMCVKKKVTYGGTIGFCSTATIQFRERERERENRFNCHFTQRKSWITWTCSLW